MGPDEYKEYQAWDRHLSKIYGKKYDQMHFDLVNNKGYHWTNAVVECDARLRLDEVCV